jgi:hypothetical protein
MSALQNALILFTVFTVLFLITYGLPNLHRFIQVNTVRDRLKEAGWEIENFKNFLMAMSRERQISFSKEFPEEGYTVSGEITGGWAVFLGGGYKVLLFLVFDEDCEIAQRWDIPSTGKHFTYDMGRKKTSFTEEKEKLLTQEGYYNGFVPQKGLLAEIGDSILDRKMEQMTLSEARELPVQGHRDNVTYLIQETVHSEYLDRDITAQKKLSSEEYISLLMKKGGSCEHISES